MRNYKAKKRGYSHEMLIKAISSVRLGERSPHSASMHFGVPRTTINNHVLGKSKSFTRGRKPVLSQTAERDLVRILLTCSEWGFGLDMDTARLAVGNYVKANNLKTPFKNGIPGVDWIYA